MGQKPEKQNKTYLIALDVGGTNTDSALIEYPSIRIINKNKTATTSDFVTGILRSIIKVIETQDEITEHYISHFMLGTTIFLNAVLQSSPELNPVEVVRLCGPLTRDYPPFGEFPEKLVEVIGTEETHFLNGGYEYTKSLVTPLDEQEIRELALKLIKKYEGRPLSVAIIGVYSPLFNDQEILVSKIMEEEFKKAGIQYYITRSNEIGQCGFKERENASILNACLLPLASKTITDLCESLKKLNLTNIRDNIFLTHNDGTLISSEQVLKYPIFTFNSGPINSLRGAYQLTQIKNAFVLDIGGTSADMAVLQNGFPRASSSYVDVGGIRTNFRMADTVSIALGGGSVVKINKESNKCTIGPVSVGYKLMLESQCFGGKILTATDIACAKGIDFGQIDKRPDPELVKLTPEEVQLAHSEIVRMVEFLVDKVKITDVDLPLILVGGGSVLIPKDTIIKGVSEIIKPEHYEVANAVGAGIAQVSVILEEVLNLNTDTTNAQEVIKHLKNKATDVCESKGAIRETVDFIVDEIHLPYTAGSQLKYVCKAFGSLDLTKNTQDVSDLDAPSKIREVNLNSIEVAPFIEEIQDKKKIEEVTFFETPTIVWNENHFEWHLKEFDIKCICLGAAYLGSGGGGSSHVGRVPVLNLLKSGKKMRVISLDSLTDNDLVLWCAHYGAPSNMIERLGSPMKLLKSIDMMKKFEETPDKKLSALAAAEIGGLNSLAPLFAGAMLDLPVLDGDFMGRAFPELQMLSPFLNGERPTPCAMSDDKGFQFVLTEIQNNNGKLAEDFLRSNIMKDTCDGAISGPSLSKEQINKYLVRHSMSHIWRLGRNILEARHKKTNPLHVIEHQENGRLAFTGKINYVSRLVQRGYNTGKVVISGFDGHFLNKTLEIQFQNENLIAIYYDDYNKKEDSKIIATVPDLIIMVDYETYEPFLCEELRYGLRTSVLILPAPDQLRIPVVLAQVGPKAFNLADDFEYVPTADYIEPRSVIDEFKPY